MSGGRREDPVLREASFDPRVVSYTVTGTAIALVFTVVGILLAPLILPLVYVLAKRQLARLRCTLRERSVSVSRGILSRMEKTIPLEKITDVAMLEGPLMRAFGVKALSFETAGSSSPGALVRLVGVEDADGFRDAVLAARDIHAEGAVAPAEQLPPVEAALLAEIRDELRAIRKAVQK